jgi:3-hydroxybutyryl-CoA dehydrogenase
MDRLAVIGAGTMGSGIAQVALQHGKLVTIWDEDQQALRRVVERIGRNLQTLVDRGRLSPEEREAAITRLVLAENVDAVCSAGMVIEATADVLAEKRSLFKNLDALCAPPRILATNSSTLSVTRIAAACARPERVIGMHFFNPVPAMRLVEIIRGIQTSQETVDATRTLAGELGKTAVEAKNRPGFIVNRVSRPFFGEPVRMLEEGVASVESIDGLLRGMGFKMGPFELLDLVGLDVNLAIATSIYDATYGEPRFRPHPLQAEMVHAGQIGRKAGKGFYAYPAE